MRSAADDPITLVGLVFETATGLRRLTVANVEHDHGLPPQSFDVLVRLARSPARRLRMNDLAAQTSLTPSGLTRAIARLEQAGLVARSVCEEDRRGAFAELTERGRVTMARVLSSHQRQIANLLGASLDDAERADLAQLLRRLRDQVNPQAARVAQY